MTKNVHFVTSSTGKTESATDALGRHGIAVTVHTHELVEIQADDFATIAVHKVKQAFEMVHQPVLAMDSGLCIDALRGFPGPFSKYVLGTIGVKGILALLASETNRFCNFTVCLAYYDKSLPEPKIFTSRIEGHLTESPQTGDAATKQGSDWSSFWQIFVPKGSTQTLSCLSRAERFKLYASEDTYYWNAFAHWFNARS